MGLLALGLLYTSFLFFLFHQSLCLYGVHISNSAELGMIDSHSTCKNGSADGERSKDHPSNQGRPGSDGLGTLKKTIQALWFIRRHPAHGALQAMEHVLRATTRHGHANLPYSGPSSAFSYCGTECNWLQPTRTAPQAQPSQQSLSSVSRCL